MFPHRSSRKVHRSRGFSLVEVLASISVFVIALTGVTQLQLVASSANAISRKRMQAQQIMSQVSSAVQYWQFEDSRLAPSSTVTGRTTVATPVVVDTTAENMEKTLDFALGDYTGGTNKAARLVKGVADSTLPGAAIDANYRVYWSVTGEDRDSDGVIDNKLISIVVRWQEGTVWRNLNSAQARFNVAILRPNYN